jgi:hypothetical protein
MLTYALLLLSLLLPAQVLEFTSLICIDEAGVCPFPFSCCILNLKATYTSSFRDEASVCPFPFACCILNLKASYTVA